MDKQQKKLYNRFLLIWAGQFMSFIGTGMTMFALGIYVFQQTNTTTSYVMVLMCAFLPPFLLRPYGGILADRYDRKIMMIFGDLGGTLGLLFIFLMLSLGRIELWHIYLGVACTSAFSAFQDPAYKALVTDLLPQDLYLKASGLVQLASSAQYLISPLLAGILLSLVRIELIFLIDIFSFLLAGISVLLVRNIVGSTIKENEHSGFISELREGFASFSMNRGVVSLVLTIMVVLFFVGLLQALLIPMLLNITTVRLAGIVQSVCATGMILGSLFIGFFGFKQNLVRMLSVSLFAAGLFFANLGLWENLIYITAAGFMFFVTLPFINSSLEVLIRKNIDNSRQGRVWAIVSNITYLGSIAAFAVAGFLADYIFNPLLTSEGLLADSVGQYIGIGDSRGIGLIFILSGLTIAFIAIKVYLDKKIRVLDTADAQKADIAANFTQSAS